MRLFYTKSIVIVYLGTAHNKSTITVSKHTQNNADQKESCCAAHTMR